MTADTNHRQASLGGVPMKHISLITLTLQNSLLILIMHYSRIMPPVNGFRYYTSTAVLFNEIIKLAISLTMSLYEIATSPRTTDSTLAALFGELARAVFTGDSWKLAIPAMLYTLQNSLQYVAVSNLDAATFQVTYQLKILTTALFSVTMLGRSLSIRKWLSLVLLMAGVGIVQIPSGEKVAPELSVKDLKNGAFHAPRSIWDLKALGSAAAGQLSRRSATYEGIDEDLGYAKHLQLNASIGLAAVTAACLLSGLAGVYFEKILKDARSDSRSASVWVRNVQLSFYSLWPALFIGVLMKDGEHIAKNGFFAGYNWVVWAAIICQALGGVIVALVVNYADNIAKNFATSISIILSALASVYLFNFHITPFYLLGTSVVIAATFLYNTDKKKASPPPISVTVPEYEKTKEAYFDIEHVGSATKGSLRGDSASTSRPSTPTYERAGKSKAADSRAAKRDS